MPQIKLDTDPIAKSYDMAAIAALAVAWEFGGRWPIARLATLLEHIDFDKTFEPATNYPGVSAFCDYEAKDFTLCDADAFIDEVTAFLGMSGTIGAYAVLTLKHCLGHATIPFERKHVLGLVIYGTYAIHQAGDGFAINDRIGFANDLITTVRSIVGERGTGSGSRLSGREYGELAGITTVLYGMVRESIKEDTLEELHRQCGPLWHTTADERDFFTFVEQLLDHIGCKAHARSQLAVKGLTALVMLIERSSLGPSVNGQLRIEKHWEDVSEEVQLKARSNAMFRQQSLKPLRDFLRRLI